MDSDLAAMIDGYKIQAIVLETDWQSIEDRLTKVVRDEIIPTVNLLLQEGYSISADDSEILGNVDKNKVPTEFKVTLRLLYHEKPLSSDRRANEMGLVYDTVRPLLEELAEKYHLEGIYLTGGPTLSD